MTPAVSVIIPAYNSGAYLHAALESVRAQSFQDLEVLVVDDGSTDNTYDVARTYAAAWPRLRVIRTEHAGLATARNRALAEMAGQWIALLDADDLWLGEKLHKCMEYLAAHPQLSVVYHPMKPIASDGRPIKVRTKRCRSGWLTERLFHRAFLQDPTAVFHKRVIETVGGFDQSLPVCVGHEFWLRVSTKFEIGLLNEPLALRRCHDSSLAQADQVRASRVKMEMLERFYFDRDGRSLIPPSGAMRRLAKVRYHTGRLYLSQREYKLAAQCLRKAISYSPAFVKSYPYYLTARLRHFIQDMRRKHM